jgi:hypothetical protein
MKKLSELNLIVYDKSSEWKFFHPATADRIAAAEQFSRANGEPLSRTQDAATLASESK